MYYHGFCIRFVELSPRSDQFDPLFLIHARHSDEILAQARSIADALDIVRQLQTQQHLNLKAAS